MVRASDSANTTHASIHGSELLKLIRAGGDANLGQTLIRLAAQAAAEHRAQAPTEVASHDAVEEEVSR